jgi:hypothetical protein
MTRPKISVPHPFAFFLAKGWEPSKLNQLSSSAAKRLEFRPAAAPLHYA